MLIVSIYQTMVLLNFSLAALYRLQKELQIWLTSFLSYIVREWQGSAKQGKGLLVYILVHMLPNIISRMAFFSSLVLSGSLSLRSLKFMLWFSGRMKWQGCAKQYPLSSCLSLWMSWQLIGCRKSQCIFQSSSLLLLWNVRLDRFLMFALYLSDSMNMILMSLRVRQEVKIFLSQYSLRPTKQIRLPMLQAVSTMYRYSGGTIYSFSSLYTPRSRLVLQQCSISWQNQLIFFFSLLAFSTKRGSVTANTPWSNMSYWYETQALGFCFLRISTASLFPLYTLASRQSRLTALFMPNRWEGSTLTKMLRSRMSLDQKNDWTASRVILLRGTYTQEPLLFLPAFLLRVSWVEVDCRKDQKGWLWVVNRYADLIMVYIAIEFISKLKFTN